MSDVSTWWEALTLTLKIYWAIAIPFTVFFVLQIIFTFIGGVGDVPDDSPDAEINADHGISFQFLTLKNLLVFFTIFGWSGIAAIDAGLSETLSFVIAIIAGLLMMTIMASLMYFLSKASADGTLNFKKALGGVGEVYLTIPGKRSSLGKVQLKVQGALRTLDAMTDDEDDIATGKLIRVTDIINDHILLVTAK
jgi:hypothetical protein